eukprot:2025322-Rhodomonas_salina.1
MASKTPARTATTGATPTVSWYPGTRGTNTVTKKGGCVKRTELVPYKPMRSPLISLGILRIVQ